MSSRTSLACGLALTLLLALPLVSADEAKADCEPGQPWIGYQTTAPIRDLVYDLLPPGYVVDVCEGEHWDGQDSVEPNRNPGTSPVPTCIEAAVIFFSYCMNADPNEGDADPLGLTPVRERLSVQLPPGALEAYSAQDVYLVSRHAQYVGVCTGGPGLEDEASCRGSFELRAGLYVRDNTPGNLWWDAWSAAGIDKGRTSEADCDQATYHQAAQTGKRSLCGRDNTAVTLMVILP